ncbi:hypothetical protein [Psychroserpens luteus]|uniref:Uncharacterized protein n=1 Tax=Psychroserpens luteus TaxID=1434066 RepID=A0ABW5ZTW0_9FLAO|nr:hypothetical protein [Psychroserpens luteus]
MNENADKHLDNLSRKVIGKSVVESPSFDFTKSVMSQINALSTSSVTTYVPLISKKVWALIILVFAGIIGYVSFGTSEEKNSWLSDLDYEFVNPLSNLEFSQTSVYAVLFLALMICIQIPLLKHYFNKRYEV